MRDIAKIKDNSPHIEKDIKYLESVLETKDEIKKNGGFKMNAVKLYPK